MAISKQKQTTSPRKIQEEEMISKAIDETLKRKATLYKKLAKM